MSTARNNLFGQLVLQTGLVTKEQLLDCLKLQRQYEEKGKRVPRLGELMAAKGYLTIDQVRELLKKQRGDEAKSDSVRVEKSPAEESKESTRKPQKAAKSVRKKSAPPKEDDTPAPEQAGGALTKGKEFAGYTILQVMGLDTFGATYKARSTKGKAVVSLRVLNETAMADSDYLRRFDALTRRAGKLKNDHILAVVDYGTAEERNYYAAEFVDGVSLRRLLDMRGRIDPNMAVSLAKDISSALQHGHSRALFHQELSPSHIVVMSDRRAKLSGLGAVPDPIRRLEHLTKSIGDVPFYIAPEQATGDGDDADARTDIYALGAVLYHALSGQPPFHGESVEEVLLRIAEEDLVPLSLVAEDIPNPLCELVQKMLAVDPDDRQQSADDLLKELEGLELGVSNDALDGETQLLPIASGSTSAQNAVPLTAAKSGIVNAAAGAGVSKRSASGSSRPTRTSIRNKAPRKSAGRKGGGDSVKRKGGGAKAKEPNMVLYAVLGLIALAIVMGLVIWLPGHLESQERRKNELERLRQEKENDRERQKTLEEMKLRQKLKEQAAAAKKFERAAKRAEAAAKRAEELQKQQRESRSRRRSRDYDDEPEERTSYRDSESESVPQESTRKQAMRSRLQGIDLNEDP